MPKIPPLPPLPTRARLGSPLASGGVAVGMLWSMENQCEGDIVVDVLVAAKQDRDFATLPDIITLGRNEAATYRKSGKVREAEMTELWTDRLQAYVAQFGWYADNPKEKDEATA